MVLTENQPLSVSDSVSVSKKVDVEHYVLVFVLVLVTATGRTFDLPAFSSRGQSLFPSSPLFRDLALLTQTPTQIRS
jgi:hypothetical protein